MVDDWNIKKMRMDTVWYHNFYDGASIEHLRQKIIEDIKKAYYYEFEDKSDGVIRIINKRFGVDTD